MVSAPVISTLDLDSALLLDSVKLKTFAAVSINAIIAVIAMAVV
jgi:hypothetical protein